MTRKRLNKAAKKSFLLQREKNAQSRELNERKSYKEKPFTGTLSAQISFSSNRQYEPEYSTVEYHTPGDETAYTASDQDFKTGRKGIYVFVGMQLAAAMALTHYGLQNGDTGSAITGAANVARNAAWLGAHLAVPHIPKIRTAFQYAAASTLQKTAAALEFNPRVKKLSIAWRKALRKKAKTIHAPAKEIRKELTKKFESQIYRDALHAKINACGALGGSAVHLPQMLASPDALVQWGAGVAALAYGKMGIDQWIEAKRWKELFNMAANKNISYDHKDAHAAVGYFRNGEFIKDTLLKWCPSLELAGKGLFYIAESTHLQNGSLLASGAIFGASAAYEFKEQNGAKLRYGFKKAVSNVPFIRPRQQKKTNDAVRRQVINSTLPVDKRVGITYEAEPLAA